MSDLLSINVNDHTEKKNGLTYLSWAWAWAEVLKIDPNADWEHIEYPQPDGTISPCIYCGGGTAMVKTKVTIKGKTRTCMLPVMNNRNQAIKDPDAFAINTAIVRCMTKNVGMFGLGLYIYAGEDLPESDDAEKPAKREEKPAVAKDVRANPAKLLGADAGTRILAARKDELEEHALKIVNAFNAMQTGVVMALYNELTDDDEALFVWDLLHKESRLRKFIQDYSREKATA